MVGISEEAKPVDAALPAHQAPGLRQRLESYGAFPRGGLDTWAGGRKVLSCGYGGTAQISANVKASSQ